MSQKLTGDALVAYLRDNPTSDAMRAAADEIERLRALLDDHRIRDVLGYVEDAGPADVWACAQSWMAGRDAALAPQEQK